MRATASQYLVRSGEFWDRAYAKARQYVICETLYPLAPRTLLYFHGLRCSNSSPALRWGLFWRREDAGYGLQAMLIVYTSISERNARFPTKVNHMRGSIFVVAHTVLGRRHRRIDFRDFRASFVAP